ncbi:hypothetical protein [Micromonospora sp. LOL_021]|uniref:hypothetical protein n=1 Tax=Micromonospora sp. LOL_021 TaxID=3345417 RepID=UPI003A8844B2
MEAGELRDGPLAGHSGGVAIAGTFDLPHPVEPARVEFRSTGDALTSRVVTVGAHRRLVTTSANTLLDAGDGTLWKVYRHASATTAREAQLLQHLTAADRLDTPHLHGRIAISNGWREIPVAVRMSAIPGYRCLGTHLQAVADGTDTGTGFRRTAGPHLSRLGALVADLHAALARPGPQQPTPVDRPALHAALRQLPDHAARTLRIPAADTRWGTLAATARDVLAAGRRPLAVGHGDLHLYQVGLSDAGIHVLDFEGETSRAPGWPSRLLAVREYDLAGLFTSLLHLCVGSRRATEPTGGSLVDELYQIFLAAYLTRQRRTGAAAIDLDLVDLLRRYRLMSEACLGRRHRVVAGQARRALRQLLAADRF